MLDVRCAGCGAVIDILTFTKIEIRRNYYKTGLSDKSAYALCPACGAKLYEQILCKVSILREK